LPKQNSSLPVSTEVHQSPSAAAQSMLEALEASLHGFKRHRQLRVELYSAAALKNARKKLAELVKEG
jgi:hypothetical protein